MKLIRFITSTALVLGLACTCTKFDDSALWQAINKNAADIAALKETTKNLNSDILALQQLVAALQNHDYITNCSPLADGTGYTIAFSSGKSIVIRNGQNGADGKDGKDGTTPQIGIRQHSDGLYYWTLNGEWLLGSDGNMIRAEGKDGKDGSDGNDGITPRMKIEDGCWYISTDNGNTWTNLGKATGTDGKDGKDGNDGESFFKNVIVGEDSVTFVLSDGTEIVLPLVFEGDIIHVSGISLSKTSVTLVEGSFETITATITPSDANNQNVFWSSSDTDIATVDANGLITAIKSGTATITAKSQDGGYTATCTVIVIPASPIEPEAVDLGLPSGLKWATCNLGASKPEEYGGYYQWAGTQDVTSTSIYLDWSGTYPYHIDNSEVYIGWTKYIPSDKSSYWSGTGSPDNKTVLDPKDDVAHVKLGGKWRMPTIEELEELIGNCNSVSTILSGVRGWQFTSKKNGRSIFLPEAGYREGGYFADVNTYGYYWSSSLDTDHPSWAHFICIRDDYNVNYGAPSCVFTDSRARFFGYSVRPVNDEYTAHVSGISLNKTAITLTEGDSETISVTFSPENVYYRYVTWSSSDTDIATVDANGLITAIKSGTATITAKSQDGGYTATCTVIVIPASPIEPEAVDLGLPSGLKWASCNLGATKPEEYGGYYQWGGLQNVTSSRIYLDWSNCPHHTDSSNSNGWMKYIPSNRSSYWSGNGNPDNKTVLDLEDDVAHETWGGKWRIPTRAEFNELINNCSSEWTTVNGVKGRKFTSRKNGYSIFMPAAGYRGGEHLYNVGDKGYYWSSSLYIDDPINAYYIYFGSGYVDMNRAFRYYGQSVRPVSE